MNNIESIKLGNDLNYIELEIQRDEVAINCSDFRNGLLASHKYSFPYKNLKDLNGIPKQIQSVILDFVKSVVKPYKCSIILEDYICASIWEKFETFADKKTS